MNRVTHSVQQGTPEWHALRASHFTASEAAAMMGCSPYESRAELLRRKATGISEEPDAPRQRMFERGHAVGCLGCHLQIGLLAEQQFQAVAEHGMIVHDENPHSCDLAWAGHGHPSPGSATTIRAPHPGCDATDRRPPIARTRSQMTRGPRPSYHK